MLHVMVQGHNYEIYIIFMCFSLLVCLVCVPLLCSCPVNVSGFTIITGVFVKDDMAIDRPITYISRIFTALINKSFLYYLSVITPVIIDVVNGMYYLITVI